VLPVIAQLPDCGWTFLRMISSENRKTTFRDHASARALQRPARWVVHDLIGKPENHFSGSCENAREMRA
jgi:hypothetical protein